MWERESYVPFKIQYRKVIFSRVAYVDTIISRHQTTIGAKEE